MYKCGRQQGTVDLDCTTLANQPPPGVYFLLAAEMEASIARSEAAAESLTLAAGGGPPGEFVLMMCLEGGGVGSAVGSPPTWKSRGGLRFGDRRPNRALTVYLGGGAPAV